MIFCFGEWIWLYHKVYTVWELKLVSELMNSLGGVFENNKGDHRLRS